MATENKMGAPWQPLTGLIDPFTSGPNNQTNHAYNDTSKEISNNLSQELQESQISQKLQELPVETFVDTYSQMQIQNTNIPTNSSTGIEKIFIYIAILLCIGIIVSILYFIFNNY